MSHTNPPAGSANSPGVPSGSHGPVRAYDNDPLTSSRIAQIIDLQARKIAHQDPKFLETEPERLICGCIVDRYSQTLNPHPTLDYQQSKCSNGSFLGVDSHGSIASSSQLSFSDEDVEMQGVDAQIAPALAHARAEFAALEQEHRDGHSGPPIVTSPAQNEPSTANSNISAKYTGPAYLNLAAAPCKDHMKLYLKYHRLFTHYIYGKLRQEIPERDGAKSRKDTYNRLLSILLHALKKEFDPKDPTTNLITLKEMRVWQEEDDPALSGPNKDYTPETVENWLKVVSDNSTDENHPAFDSILRNINTPKTPPSIEHSFAGSPSPEAL